MSRFVYLIKMRINVLHSSFPILKNTKLAINAAKISYGKDSNPLWFLVKINLGQLVLGARRS